MAGFANDINTLLDLFEGKNETTIRKPCIASVNHYKFYQFALIPALLITMMYAVTKKRQNLYLDVFSGRPGLIFPMDSLTRSSRLSYACAFGATANLVYKIVVDQTHAIDYEGHRAVKSFIALASMFIYGMVFFPLFTSFAIGSVFGYALGSVYVWMLTGIEFVRLTECDAIWEVRLLVIFSGLPSALCFLYLSISLPVRAVLAFGQGKYFYWDDNFAETNTLKDIRESYSGHHVMDLFKKPEVNTLPQGKKAKIVDIFMNLVHRFIYHRKKGFRYPSRIISVMLVAVTVVYTLTFQLMTVLPPYFELWQYTIIYYLGVTIGAEAEVGEEEVYTIIRQWAYVAYYLVGILKICFIVSCSLATLFAFLNILHSLSSFRANLLSLYRGDHSSIPAASAYSNTSNCVNSIKYAGYQVGYIIWSYLLQMLILFLVCFVIAFVVLLIENELTKYLELLLNLLWPLVLTAVVVAVTQILLAKFVFLQERGQFLALNNRACYFNFTYFMFFYNIFLGLVSCLLRILKATFVGTAFLSRLDSSTLPRRFEFIDPGFKAYVGYLHVEAAHTHPVLITFTRLMLLALQNKKEREADRGGVCKDNLAFNMEPTTKKPANTAKVMPDENGDCAKHHPRESIDLEKDEAVRRKRLAARFNWHVTYTLLHNPDIRIMRKGYIQLLRQAKLLGVAVPISDRRDDVDVFQLQSNIWEAKRGATRSAKQDKGQKTEDEESMIGEALEVHAAEGMNREFSVVSGLRKGNHSSSSAGGDSEPPNYVTTVKL